jgi:predicted small lipoprotein YifL
VTRFSRLGLAGALLASAAGCGRKAPPLPPEQTGPAAPAQLAARVVEGRVDVQFMLPDKNTDGSSPVALTRVDVYAVSLVAGAQPPKRETLTTPANLIGHVDVRLTGKDDASARADVKGPIDQRPAPGELATFSDTPPPPGEPLLWADAQAKPLRLYALVGIANGRRKGPMSAVLVVPVGAAPDPPQGAIATYDETTVTLAWPGEAGGPFRVYAVDRDGKELPSALMTPSPIAAHAFTTPVTFGVTTCLSVRAVAVSGSITTESAAARAACITPVDTFPPPVPTGLNAVPDVGVVQLAWNAVTAPDLAGYIVLRREVGTATFERLTLSPVRATTWDDTKVRAGVDYEYAVRAVDQATPPNESRDSEHKIVTARTPSALHKDF